MNKKISPTNTLLLAILLGMLLASGTALACDGMGPSTHMGQLLSINSETHTFTIRDAQSSNPITFEASKNIISGLKGFAGNLMVNYEKSDAGGLNAVDVAF
ncbi:MAG: hypothetical protein GXP17_06945 [Gammaproteobacteria bacterium]|nr:hypothetical protein [Gammaproteobacteria bacterium]